MSTTSVVGGFSQDLPYYGSCIQPGLQALVPPIALTTSAPRPGLLSFPPQSPHKAHIQVPNNPSGRPVFMHPFRQRCCLHGAFEDPGLPKIGTWVWLLPINIFLSFLQMETLIKTFECVPYSEFFVLFLYVTATILPSSLPAGRVNIERL